MLCIDINQGTSLEAIGIKVGCIPQVAFGLTGIVIVVHACTKEVIIPGTAKDVVDLVETSLAFILMGIAKEIVLKGAHLVVVGLKVADYENCYLQTFSSFNVFDLIDLIYII